MRNGSFAAVAFFVIAAVGHSVLAATYTVDTTVDDGSLSACSASVPDDCSLRGAIAAAILTTDDDTINFSIPTTDPNCPGGVCTITLTHGELVIPEFRIINYYEEVIYGEQLDESGNPVYDDNGNPIQVVVGIDRYPVYDTPTGNLAIINSTGAPNLIFSGNNQSRVFSIGTPLLEIRGSSSHAVTLSGVTVTGGTASSGGGIYASECSLTISNSTIMTNTTYYNGGGIYIERGDLTLTGSTVSGNISNDFGGGSSYGGGIAAVYSHVVVGASTISGNTAFKGGGIQTLGGDMILSGVTITQNQASWGGGIYNNDSYYNPSYARLHNSIVAGNNATVQGPDVYGSIHSESSYSIFGDGSGMRGLSAGSDTNQIGDSSAPINAGLGPLANNGGPTLTHALLAGSPAVDAGNTTSMTDQRGYQRPVDASSIPNAAGGNGADIGAFEVQISQPTSMEQCKNNGWTQFTTPKFKNQGDCILFVNTGR